MTGIKGPVLRSFYHSEKVQPLDEKQYPLVVHTQEKAPTDGSEQKIGLSSAALWPFRFDDMHSMVDSATVTRRSLPVACIITVQPIRPEQGQGPGRVATLVSVTRSSRGPRLHHNASSFVPRRALDVAYYFKLFLQTPPPSVTI